MGLTIRQAQICLAYLCAVSAQTISVPRMECTFEISSPTTYVLFADAVAKNGLYDQGELVEATDIGRGYRIGDLLHYRKWRNFRDMRHRKIDILFKRPEPTRTFAPTGPPASTSAAESLLNPQEETE